MSGLPFTSERQLTGAGPAEATATSIECSRSSGSRTTSSWNVVPTHPHRLGEPASNRRPNAREIAGARPFLDGSLSAGRSCRSVESRRLRSGSKESAIHRTAGLRHSVRRDLPEQFPIKRNTTILAVVVAVNSAVLQLGAAVLTLTFVLVTGFRALIGAGPAIYLTAVRSPHSRPDAMDRFGRVPVIATGFLLGSAGCLLTASGTHWDQTVLVIVGRARWDVRAVTLLIRTAAGDIPARAPGAGHLVLFGAVFGAILGPAVFGPFRRQGRLGGHAHGALARRCGPLARHVHARAHRAAGHEGDRRADLSPRANAASHRCRANSRDPPETGSPPRCSPPSRASASWSR